MAEQMEFNPNRETVGLGLLFLFFVVAPQQSFTEFIV